MKIISFNYEDVDGDDLESLVIPRFNLQVEEYAIVFYQYDNDGGQLWIGTKDEIKNVLIGMIGSEEYGQSNSEVKVYVYGKQIPIQSIF